jgi:hypothetical protein
LANRNGDALSTANAKRRIEQNDVGFHSFQISQPTITVPGVREEIHPGYLPSSVFAAQRSCRTSIEIRGPTTYRRPPSARRLEERSPAGGKVNNSFRAEARQSGNKGVGYVSGGIKSVDSHSYFRPGAKAET